MTKLLKIKVCEIQTKDQFAKDVKLGMIIYVPFDRFVDKTNFDEVNI